MNNNIIEGVDITTLTTEQLATLSDFIAIKKQKNLASRTATLATYTANKDSFSVTDAKYASQIATIAAEIAEKTSKTTA